MSSTDQATGVIIKSDRIGRTRYTAQHKQEVLAAFAASSLSAPVFARQCGIKYPTFAAWVAAKKLPARHPSPGQPTFILATTADAADRGTLEIHLPGGAIVRADGSGQVRLLAELLRHLA